VFFKKLKMDGKILSTYLYFASDIPKLFFFIVVKALLTLSFLSFSKKSVHSSIFANVDSVIIRLFSTNVGMSRLALKSVFDI
jgi:hypothetical protein